MAGKLKAVVGIGNQKGGVGKTTNAVHIAAALGERGYRCLIIDLDPSAGATRHLGVPVQSFSGTLEMLTTDEDPKALVLTKKLPRRVHLIPSRPQLSELDSMLSKFDDKTYLLERPLKLIRRHYDFIFLDTPPNPQATTTVAAYASSSWFMLSAFPHPLSMVGLNEALKDIADVRRRRNPNLEILGVILTCVDTRTRMAAEFEHIVSERLPGRAFQTATTQAIAVPDVSGKGKTLFQLKSLTHHKVAEQYRYLAAEIEHRVLNREAFLAGILALLDLESIQVEVEEQIEEEIEETLDEMPKVANV